MKEDEKKRLSAVLHATEYLFLENMALKLALEHRGIANWQKLVDHLISDKDVLVDQPQQMVFGNLIVQTEVVEQRLTPGVVSHHDQQPPTIEIQQSMNPSNTHSLILSC